jgi:hypothetical protein
MKICPVRTELFHADGQTIMTKLIVAFRSFSNESKKDLNCPSSSSPFQTVLTFG